MQTNIQQNNLGLFQNGYSPELHIVATDAKHGLSLSAIREQLKSSQVSRDEYHNFGFSDKVYWLGMQLSNTSGSRQDLILEIEYALLDYIDFFLIDSASGKILQKIESGDALPFSHRPIRHPNFAFPINLEDRQDAEIILRIQTTSSSQFPIKLWLEHSFASISLQQSVLIGGLLTCFGFMAIYHLFLFFSLRELSNLYFGAILSGYLLVEGVLTGYAYYLFWPASPAWNDVSLTVTSNFAIANLALFTRSFLALPDRLPKLAKGFLKAAWCGLAFSAVSTVLPYHFMIKVTSTYLVVVPVGSYLAGIYLATKRYKPAYLYCIAFTVFVATSLLLVFSKLGTIERNLVTEYSIHFWGTDDHFIPQLRPCRTS